ncbi:hypothetical protein M9H77_16927 [Catharanthus roseus]|uniref:Uncharacterized protein n=1 Tax=Catharanthus roseus TaxID=4058 RepID=A0ACC0B362_CATRO|nr:hypothetical protein M9H77_16927 [Catharanthus roseus]
MRRQGGGGGGGGGGGHYAGDGNPSHGYAAAPPPPHMQQQQSKSDHHHNQWRWERDGSKVQSPMSPHMFNEGQGNEASRSYYQGQRPDPRMAMEKQGSYDARSQPRADEMERYEENPLRHTLEGLEQKFLNDIMKLSKEQNDAEDAEIARHRERINAINAQYQEQLVALRAQHATRRDEFLRRESHSRQQQYQQAAGGDHYPSGGGIGGSSDPQGYNAVAAPSREPSARSYNADNYDTYRERGRFLGNSRNHEPEPRAQYPGGGRVYDTGSRYY